MNSSILLIHVNWGLVKKNWILNPVSLPFLKLAVLLTSAVLTHVILLWTSFNHFKNNQLNIEFNPGIMATHSLAPPSIFTYPYRKMRKPIQPECFSLMSSCPFAVRSPSRWKISPWCHCSRLNFSSWWFVLCLLCCTLARLHYIWWRMTNRRPSQCLLSSGERASMRLLAACTSLGHCFKLKQYRTGFLYGREEYCMSTLQTLGFPGG